MCGMVWYRTKRYQQVREERRREGETTEQGTEHVHLNSFAEVTQIRKVMTHGHRGEGEVHRVDEVLDEVD